jgi:hypothetical protein
MRALVQPASAALYLATIVSCSYGSLPVTLAGDIAFVTAACWKILRALTAICGAALSRPAFGRRGDPIATGLFCVAHGTTRQLNILHRPLSARANCKAGPVSPVLPASLAAAE